VSDFEVAVKNLHEFSAEHMADTGHRNFESLQRTLAAYAVQQNLKLVLTETGLLQRTEAGENPVRLQDFGGWDLYASAGVILGRQFVNLKRSRINEHDIYEQDAVLITERGEGGNTLATISRVVEDGGVVSGNYSSLALEHHGRQENLLREVALFSAAEFNSGSGRELGEDEIVTGLLRVSARAIRSLVDVVDL
jgi:hypothetical protein